MSNSNREYGPREKITCNLPHPSRSARGGRYESGMKGESTMTETILNDLETALCQLFGGYTATPMVGGWINANGELMHEPGTQYSVSYVPGKGNGGRLKPLAITLFVAAGERLGEEWIHIERSGFQAEHRRTANGRGEYDNSENDDNGNSGDNGNSIPANVAKIRQLDKETRDLINNGARSTEHVRR